jgi:hypothetical protein
MRTFLICLLVVTSSPVLSQTQVENLAKAEKTACLNRELGRLMQGYKQYSINLLASIASDAAHICRGLDPYDYALEKEARDIAYGLLPTDQRNFIEKMEERILRRGAGDER